MAATIENSVKEKFIESSINPLSSSQERIIAAITTPLNVYVKKHKLGQVHIKPSLLTRICSSSSLKLNIFYFAIDNSGNISNIPTLTIEVISEDDLYYDVEENMHLSFEAGAKQVWIVNPFLESVQVVNSTLEGKFYRRNRTLSGGLILPDFQLPVAEIFDI